MLLMFVATGVGVSLASASAPPSSPLYGIKRAEEWLALHTAGSDQRRGDILLTIASRRLSEAQAESDANQGTSVHSLVQELDEAVTDVINLATVMTSRHEDIAMITEGLQRILNDEDAAQSHAQKHGYKSLADALGDLQGRQLKAIQSHHLKLPRPIPGNNSGGKVPHATQTPDDNVPHATQTPSDNGNENDTAS